MEDDLFQFWCGNMVKLAAMIVCIGYLALGMDLDSSFVIFTICCFQKYLIELYILFLMFGSLGAGISGCFVIEMIYFLCFLICSLISLECGIYCMETDHFSTLFHLLIQIVP